MCVCERMCTQALCTRARLTPVAMETELHANRQPAAEDGVGCGDGVVVAGIKGGGEEEKKKLLLFWGSQKRGTKEVFAVASPMHCHRTREYESSHICCQHTQMRCK